METNISAIFQIVVKSGQMIYRNKLVNFSKEQFDDFCKTIPPEWWHKKDQLAYFTYYDDGSYFCERIKTVYDYSLKQEIERAYEYNFAPDSEAKNLFDLFCSFFEKVRLEDLRVQKEFLRQEIEKRFDYISIQFRNIRDHLLVASDWTQLPDIVEKMTEEEVNMWKTYRQYLRDMPNTDTWLNKEYIKIEYPLPPDLFVKKFPEEEYLSSPRHFKNYITLRAKEIFYELVRTLSLPSAQEEVNKANYSELDFDALEYLISMTNDQLSTIDPTLKIEIKLSNEALESGM